MYEENGFANRLGMLYAESRLSLEKFADRAGVSPSAMKNYLKGDRELKSSTIQKICNSFSVSADWLLGLSNTRTQSADIQNAINVLGLSEDATKEICYITQHDQMGNALSSLIEEPGFEELIISYNEFLRLGERIRAKIPQMTGSSDQSQEPEITDDGKIVMNVYEALVHLINKTGSIMRGICEQGFFEARIWGSTPRIAHDEDN